MVQTDVGPYHIVLAVLVYMYADFVHKQAQATLTVLHQVAPATRSLQSTPLSLVREGDRARLTASPFSPPCLSTIGCLVVLMAQAAEGGAGISK